MSQIRQLFKETRDEYAFEYDASTAYADFEIQKIIEKAKQESMYIYQNLSECDFKKNSSRAELEKINTMFSMQINFEDVWLKFLGIA